MKNLNKLPIKFSKQVKISFFGVLLKFYLRESMANCLYLTPAKFEQTWPRNGWDIWLLKAYHSENLKILKILHQKISWRLKNSLFEVLLKFYTCEPTRNYLYFMHAKFQQNRFRNGWDMWFSSNTLFFSKFRKLKIPLHHINKTH